MYVYFSTIRRNTTMLYLHPDNPDGDPPVQQLILGIMVAVLLLIIIVYVVVYYVRRRRRISLGDGRFLRCFVNSSY